MIFSLTPYGKQKLSMGKLKPTYYAFFDDNVLYDSSNIQILQLPKSRTTSTKELKKKLLTLRAKILFNQIMSGTLVSGGPAGGPFSEMTLNQKDNLYTTEAFIGDALLQSEDTRCCACMESCRHARNNFIICSIFSGHTEPRYKELELKRKIRHNSNQY